MTPPDELGGVKRKYMMLTFFVIWIVAGLIMVWIATRILPRRED
jgi:hypothetical protein